MLVGVRAIQSLARKGSRGIEANVSPAWVGRLNLIRLNLIRTEPSGMAITQSWPTEVLLGAPEDISWPAPRS